MKYYSFSIPNLILKILNHIERMKQMNKHYPKTISENYNYFITMEKNDDGIIYFEFKSMKDYNLLKNNFTFITYPNFIKIIKEYEKELKKK
jgi:hypothetical protein